MADRGEQRLRQMLAASSDIVFTLDREQRYTAMYGAWLAPAGLTEDFFLGHTARELFGEEPALVHEGANARALSGENIVYEWSFQAAGLGVRHIQTAVSPLRDEAGDVIGVLGIGRDLTDMYNARDALRRAEERFERTFHAAPLAMTVGRLSDGVFVDVNEAALALFEGSREEFLGKSATELGLFQASNQRLELYDRLARDGRVRMFEISGRTRAGKTIEMMCSVEKLELDGEPHIISSVLDVTEQRKLEAQLRHAQKLDAIGQLAAGVAHDFNNLLAALSLQLGMLQGDEPAPHEETQAAIEEMLATVERASSLTRQLLMFGRRDALIKKRHDLVRVLAETEKLLRRVLGEQIELSVEKSQVPLWIDGDETMLQQVVMNLCINARDAMPRGGKVQVVLVGEGDSALLRVSDEGPGIDRALVDRIFEPFFTTKEVGKGSGLGLSAVHGIVTQHGGTVWAENNPGAGSTLFVRIPLVQPTDEQPEPSVARAVVAGAGRVLLVEDEPMVRRMASRCIRELGYDVVEAANADEAFAVWQRESGRFDLLFTDMVMPGRESGVELGHRLRGSKPDLRVIIASGYSMELVNARAPLDASFTFLSKPYTRPLLAATLRSSLAR